MNGRQARGSSGVPWPMAVGVLAVADGVAEAERRAARLDVALLAYKLGYFLMDVVEVSRAGGGYDVAGALIAQADAELVIAHGPVALDRVVGEAVPAVDGRAIRLVECSPRGCVGRRLVRAG